MALVLSFCHFALVLSFVGVSLGEINWFSVFRVEKEIAGV